MKTQWIQKVYSTKVTNYCVVTSIYNNTRWDVTIDTSFSISKFVAEQKSKQTAIAHHHRNTCSRDVEKPHWEQYIFEIRSLPNNVVPLWNTRFQPWRGTASGRWDIWPDSVLFGMLGSNRYGWIRLALVRHRHCAAYQSQRRGPAEQFEQTELSLSSRDRSLNQTSLTKGGRRSCSNVKSGDDNVYF